MLRKSPRFCSGPPFGRSSPLHGVVHSGPEKNALHTVICFL
jgi:hypothetical protein